MNMKTRALTMALAFVLVMTIALPARCQSVELWIGKNSTKVNGVARTTDVAPQIMNSRTMVPVRFVVDNLNYTVNWDGTTSTVTIEY